jgi:hypothetical protein
MAYAQKAFNKFQISNVEGTVGTAEAAVEVLFGQIKMPVHDRVKHTPEQDRGVLAKNYEAPFDVSKEVELEITGELYDRICAWMFSNGIRGNITPTQPDNVNEPNHYLWTFEPGLTTGNTPDITNGIDTFTLEYGDNVQAYETEYVFTTSIEISGTVNEPIEFAWTVQGRQVTETTFTGALTAPAAAYFAFNNASFYIDTSYAGLGGTQKTGMLRAFTWKLDTMFSARFSSDGNLYFSSLNEEPKAVELELTYYRDGTNSEAEFDKFLADTMFYPSIELLSDTEMDSAQGNPEYLKLQGAFRYTEFPEMEDEDGTNVVTVTAESFYDATSSKMISVLLGTKLDAYP